MSLAQQIDNLRWSGPCVGLGVHARENGPRVTIALTLAPGDGGKTEVSWSESTTANPQDVIASILRSAGSLLAAEGIEADPEDHLGALV